MSKRTPSASAPAAAVGYLRVSSSEQAASGLGLEAQRAAIVAAADRLGLTVSHWAEDAAVSGSIAPASRPGLGYALTLLGSGGTLIVAKADRMARKASDLLALRDLSERDGWGIVAADGSYDSTTPHGRAMSTVSAAFAELERDLIRSRTREALAVKRAEGVRLGRPVTLAQDVRERIAAERAAGRTLQAIADGLNADNVPTARGGATWRPSQVRAVVVSMERDAEAAALAS